MAFHHIFPQVYFRYKLADHERSKQELLDQFNVEDSEYDGQWNCNSTRIEMPPGPIIPLVTPVLRAFGEDVGKSAKIFVDSSWINFYRTGAFQEIHNHVGRGCQLALVYFVRYSKKDDAKFYFYNTNTDIISADLTALLNGPVGSFGSVAYPNVEEGDVLIFPSYMHHGVSPHNGEGLRVTLSCNLSYKMRGDSRSNIS